MLQLAELHGPDSAQYDLALALSEAGSNVSRYHLVLQLAELHGPDSAQYDLALSEAGSDVSRYHLVF